MRIPKWTFLWLSAAAMSAAAPAPIILPARKIDSQPLVKLDVGGKSTPLLVDTGSGVPLVLFSSREDTTLRSAKGGQVLASAAVILPSRIPGAEGIVGWPVLKASVWKLDLPSRSHQFLPGLPAEARGWTSFPLSKKRESLAILHPRLGEVFLDSGARRGVCLAGAKWAEWKKANAAGRALTLAEGFSPSSPGGAFANEVLHGTRFRMEPLILENTNVGEAFFDAGHDGTSILLGLEALAGLTMIVDGPGGRVYFQTAAPAKGYPATLPNRLQTAFLPDPGLTNALVVKVLPGGAGEKAGLRNGDLIVGLDGTKAPPSFQTLYDLVRKPGARATLAILRKRQPMEIQFVVP